MDWRYYAMGALGQRAEFYAPDLSSAFTQARKRWPNAKTWTCFGSHT